MRMRLWMSVVAMLLVATMMAAPVQAQEVSGFVESWNTVSEGNVTPQLNFLINGPIKGDLGWTAWSLNSKSWSEATVGLTYKPAEWAEVSASIGMEHAAKKDNSLRLGASVFMKRGRLSFLSIREEGVDYWYRHLCKFQATETFAIGVESRRFFGTGLHAEQKLSDSLSLWGTVRKGKGVISARLSF